MESDRWGKTAGTRGRAQSKVEGDGLKVEGRTDGAERTREEDNGRRIGEVGRARGAGYDSGLAFNL
jgi:hypothetical protein